jgi:hypothetical protein
VTSKENKLPTANEKHLVVFNKKEIRRILHNNEWWFSVIDVIEVLSGSNRPRKYWVDLKEKIIENEGFSELSEKIGQLKLSAPDGKLRETDCANTETLFRIVQSIPSPKAEPFKRWLAKAGYERVQEIEDPELASKRARALYQAKGYPESWIEKRMRGIAIREELTDEWKNREVGGDQEYAILPLKFQKIFTMLGEASTTEIARKDDAQGFDENKSAAVRGGRVAGNARLELEEQTKQSVVTQQNYLGLTDRKKKLHAK